jgi:DNA repair protein RadC
MYKGTMNASVLRIAELLHPAILRKCPNIILCHNHPSTDPSPSSEDKEITQQMVAAAKLLDIDVLDHLIIGGSRYISLKEQLRW